MRGALAAVTVVAVGMGVQTVACKAPTSTQSADPSPGPTATASLNTSERPVPATPSSAPSPPACWQVGGPIRAPRRISGKAFRIPKSVEGAQTVGGVLLYQATITEEGAVRDLRLQKPGPARPEWSAIDRAAREAIRTWRYTPTVVSGRRVPVCISVSIIVDVW